MSVLMLATVGGLVSFASTSLGTCLSLFSDFFAKARGSSNRWNFSIDFALGLMVSASAFTLIGPAAFDAKAKGLSVLAILVTAGLGMAFVILMKQQIERFKTSTEFNTNHLLLASVLMLHNFPEGLASGSALAGLSLKAALPILSGISIQNIPEGLLMVVCLKAMGWSKRHSFLGGIGSGVVELIGGIFAGVLLGLVTGILPFLLAFAGGSMMASVLVEIFEREQSTLQVMKSTQFLLGLVALPVLQWMTS